MVVVLCSFQGCLWLTMTDHTKVGQWLSSSVVQHVCLVRQDQCHMGVVKVVA
jgi:hypothetical protein